MLSKIPSSKYVHFVSLGCARNLVDTEVMLGLVLHAGYQITDRMDTADYLVVNTCGFLEASRQESCDTIASFIASKKPTAKVIVTGCMVSKYGEKIKELFPEVHYLLGPGDTDKILTAIGSGEQGEALGSAKSYLEWGEVPRQLSTPPHYAYLKIAEGCAKRCAFCIIPLLKGKLRSKTQEQILKEFHALLEKGVYEIILIAQDLGDYGFDRGEQHALETLIKEILNIKKPFWLRLLYLYPDEITEGLIDLMSQDKRLCAYLDMPIQHINSTMLKAMRRKTSKEHIIHTLTQLRAKIPHITIRTSLMVGFPGETEEMFEELLSFVTTYPLDHVGVFKFSKEEGAHAATLPNHIPEDIKDKRFHRLTSLLEELAPKRSGRWVGKTLEVVVEGYHPETPLLMRGRFYGQCPEIDGMVIINDGRKVKAFGKRYLVNITDVAGYDLIGTVLSLAPDAKTPQPLKCL